MREAKALTIPTLGTHVLRAVPSITVRLNRDDCAAIRSRTGGLRELPPFTMVFKHVVVLMAVALAAQGADIQFLDLSTEAACLDGSP